MNDFWFLTLAIGVGTTLGRVVGTILAAIVYKFFYGDKEDE